MAKTEPEFRTAPVKLSIGSRIIGWEINRVADWLGISLTAAGDIRAELGIEWPGCGEAWIEIDDNGDALIHSTVRQQWLKINI